MHFIILGHTSNLISYISIITYFRMITLQGTIFWTTSSNKELAHRWLPYLARSYISSEEVFSSLNNSDSRPSNFLFQIARGSGATLSECTFSSKKRTTLERLFQDNNFQTTKDSRPSSSLFQIATGSGDTLSECTFFFEKAHVTKKTSSRQNYFKDS